MSRACVTYGEACSFFISNFIFKDYSSLLPQGPTVGKWYRILEGIYGKEAVVKKVLTDQLIFSPVFIAILVTSLNLLQGLSWDEAVTKVQNSYFDILLTGYQVNFHPGYLF